MPANKAFDDGDTSTAAVPTSTITNRGTNTTNISDNSDNNNLNNLPNESSLLSGHLDTYFSDEKIIIPNIETVSYILNLEAVHFFKVNNNNLFS